MTIPSKGICKAKASGYSFPFKRTKTLAGEDRVLIFIHPKQHRALGINMTRFNRLYEVAE